MDLPHYAAIDIGSNAVRLLIKRLENSNERRFSKEVMLRVPLRLGQDVFTQGRLSDRKSDALVDLMRAYSIVLKLYDVKRTNMRVCATQAMREAQNAKEVCDRIRHEVGLNVEVISGEEEASIVSSLRPSDDNRTLVFVDVGGGSTEVTLISGGHTYGRHSFPIGTVKILNGLADDDWHRQLTVGLKEMVVNFVSHHEVSTALDDAVIVGAGGNINKLFAMAQERDSFERSMSLASLVKLRNELASKTVEERMTAFQLKTDRAEVIVYAADIFICVAETLAINNIEIPSDGLAGGIINQLSLGNLFCG